MGVSVERGCGWGAAWNIEATHHAGKQQDIDGIVAPAPSVNHADSLLQPLQVARQHEEGLISATKTRCIDVTCVAYLPKHEGYEGFTG